MIYNSFSVSVKGESHIRKNIVCQDYSGHIDNDNIKIAVISDGHGDNACFRSHKGSEFAVKACIEGFLEFSNKIIKGDINYNDFAVEKRKKEFIFQMAKGIIAKWNMYVIKDLEENPVSVELEEIKNIDFDNDVLKYYQEGKNLNHIYGATLIAVMIVDNFIVALQQGDGKCLFLNKQGDFYEPVPWDDRCYMNVTTSICDEDAADSCRFYIDRIDNDSLPIGIFVASDGIEDSYNNREAMLCFYRIMCTEIAEKGLSNELDYMKKNWLADISKNGSADDMSVAGIVDVTMLRPLINKFEKDNLLCTLNENISDAEERKKSMEYKMAYLDKTYNEINDDIKKIENNLNSSQNNKQEAQYEQQKLDIKVAKRNKITQERDEYIVKYNELTDKYNQYIEEKNKL